MKQAVRLPPPGITPMPNVPVALRRAVTVGDVRPCAACLRMCYPVREAGRAKGVHMWQELSPGIVSDPEILGGQPTLKGHRLAVSQLLAQLAAGMPVREIQDNYQLTDADNRAILLFAA